MIIPNIDINKYKYKYIAVVDQFTCFKGIIFNYDNKFTKVEKHLNKVGKYCLHVKEISEICF